MPARRPKPMMAIFRKLHHMIGSGFAIFLCVTALSGTVLIFSDFLLSWSLGTRATSLASLPKDYEIAAITRLEEYFPPETIRQIAFPSDHKMFFGITLYDGSERFFDPFTLEELHGRYAIPQLLRFLRDLHTHLLSGTTGEVLIGGIGLAGTALVISGIALWYPGRKGFRFKHIFPKSRTRGQILSAHRSTGILLSALMCFSALTGSAMIFDHTTKTLLSGLLDFQDAARAYDAEGIPVPDTPGFYTGVSFLHLAKQYFPEARITSYMPPNATRNTHIFRLKNASEWLPNGRNYIHFSKTTGQIVFLKDARTAPRSQRIFDSFYPLHSAAIGGVILDVLIVLSGLGLTYISGTGLYSWLHKKLKKKSPPRS
tara:strand:- start:665 stop:1777 length:1113 start_codon:yes stop_codon:yes gene_type:complete